MKIVETVAEGIAVVETEPVVIGVFAEDLVVWIVGVAEDLVVGIVVDAEDLVVGFQKM